jgi:alpha-D-ribose 1-methylphosphonate 5-triphosphate diphosphatase PhnM
MSDLSATRDADTPPPACSNILTHEERNDIAEILKRRANEIASFKTDLEERVAKLTGQAVRFHELPGSIELAMRREMDRLRALEERIKVKRLDNDE